MPKTLRDVLGSIAGAVVAFISYKIVYALLGGVANETLRVILSAIPGAVLGIGAMYLIFRSEKAQP